MANLIPREILFGNPTQTVPKISPDGTKMAYLAPVNNVLNVWVGDPVEGDYQPVTHDDDRGVRLYFWGQDNQHILYIQDVGGNENWRLYSTDIASGNTRELTPFENVQVQIVDYSKHHPDQMLIGLNKDDPRFHDVYRLTLSTGEMEMVAKNPGNVAAWLTDADFKVRGTMIARPDGGFNVQVRESEDSEWKTVVEWDRANSLSSHPVSFTRDGQGMYLSDSRDANSARLVLLDFESGETSVLAEDPTYDVGGVLIHPDTYEVQAVAFFRDRLEWTVLDDAVSSDFEALRKLNHGDFGLISRDNDDSIWIMRYVQDDGPVAFFRYDRASQDGTFLFHDRPELGDYELAAMHPIRFEARDGLTIHGYITYPPGEKHENVPMVLNVHGGPWGRDTWGYHPEAQWLANRGYACLQVNFRGSTGYGKELLNAGDREWGRKMHYDLVDGVQWAIDEGIANSDHVAIYGGSYGGYAALVGATFTPDVFCCAVDIVGPSNLVTLIKSVPPYWATFLANFKQRVGDPDTEEDFLKSRSPLFKVDQIRCPILIAQGANDPRVKQAESEQIVEAMEERGIDYEYLLFPDEGHGFAKPENRMAFYTAAEKFLAKHLGGRYQE